MTELLASPVRRRRFGPGAVLFGGVLVLILLFMAALGIGWLAAKQRVRTELARMRAAGEPISPEDLEAFYQKPPADRDTTQLWLDAIAAIDTDEFRADAKGLPSVGGAGEGLPPPDKPWPKQPAVEALLTKYHEPLEKMHGAAELGGAARYPTAFSVDYQTSVPHLVQVRSIVRLLLLECEARARQDEPSATAGSIEAMFAAANSISDEPTVSAQLIRLALDGMARFKLERQLSSVHFSENDLERIDRQLTAADYRASFHRAMLGARVTGMEYFGDPAALGRQAPMAASAIFRPSDQMVYLTFMEKLIAAFETSGPTLRDAVADVDQEAKQLAHEIGARLRCPISMIMLSSMPAVAVSLNRGIAYRDAARVAVAIERYRLRNGELQEVLDSLVPEFLPEVPLDPFDGKPLRFRLEANEYKIYSVGTDGIDQGGQADETQPSIPPDFVFRVRLNDPPAQE